MSKQARFSQVKPPSVIVGGGPASTAAGGGGNRLKMLPASGAALGAVSSLPALARAGPASAPALAPPLPARGEFDVVSAAPALPLTAATLPGAPVVVGLGLAIGAEALPGAPALCSATALRAGATPPALELSQAKLESPRHAPRTADCHAE
jgi:hypothetical protein